MKVLFLGGTGTISTACVRLALAHGNEVHLLNRNQRYPIPPGAHLLQADLRDAAATRAALGDTRWDVVADFIAFTPAHIETALDLFRGRTAQYVFISSASAYQKPLSHPVITESTPLCNPLWEYSRQKIACEEMLTAAYRTDGFPMTIVRPSHTYDRNVPPSFGPGDFTLVDRLRRGKKVIIHGDGTSLWALTHSEDFAKAFTGLLGNIHALGHAFHITSDELLTWNQIYAAIAQAAGAEPRIVHLTSDFIAARHEPARGGLLGDKAHSVIFDNTKIKRFVPGFTATIPFSEGVRRAIAWFDADPARQKIDTAGNQLLDDMLTAAGEA